MRYNPCNLIVFGNILKYKKQRIIENTQTCRIVKFYLHKIFFKLKSIFYQLFRIHCLRQSYRRFKLLHASSFCRLLPSALHSTGLLGLFSSSIAPILWPSQNASRRPYIIFKVWDSFTAQTQIFYIILIFYCAFIIAHRYATINRYVPMYYFVIRMCQMCHSF